MVLFYLAYQTGDGLRRFLPDEKVDMVGHSADGRQFVSFAPNVDSRKNVIAERRRFVDAKIIFT